MTEDKKRIEDTRKGYYDNDRDTIDFLLAQLDRAHAALRDIRDNYDCDSDAHKYGTPCRCCTARKALGEE